jgi:hypothetical protein
MKMKRVLPETENFSGLPKPISEPDPLKWCLPGEQVNRLRAGRYAQVDARRSMHAGRCMQVKAISSI